MMDMQTVSIIAKIIVLFICTGLMIVASVYMFLAIREVDKELKKRTGHIKKKKKHDIEICRLP